MRIFLPASICLVAVAVATSGAASVIPSKTFAELVSQADQIFRGEVLAVSSRWAIDSSAIETVVDFRVDRILKGTLGRALTLSFLGGTVGETTLTVDGMPQFAVGERGVFFVRAGASASPIVGFSQGRFPIRRDRTRGADVVVTPTGRAFANTPSVGTLAPSGPIAAAMSLEAFEQDIVQRLPRR
jgi:hypothetical protein